jgi:hypothetical protein
MDHVVKATNKQSGQVKYLARKPKTNQPNDNVLHGSPLTSDFNEALRYTSYPEATAAGGWLETWDEDFDCEVVDVPPETSVA